MYRSVGVKVSTPLFHGGDKGALPLPSTNCGMWQWLAVESHNLEVEGSNPSPATKELRYGVTAAQEILVLLVKVRILVSQQKTQ